MNLKPLAFNLVFTLVTSVHAADGYDDYESFYADQPNRLFGEPIVQERNIVYTSPSNQGIFTENTITIGKRKARIKLGQNFFTLNGRRYLFKNAKAFPKELVSDIYPVSADIFTTGSDQKQCALCINGYSNGSGEMNRYAQIYLLLNPFSKSNKQVFLHLPGLLSSCRGVLFDKQGELSFPSNSYVFHPESKDRIGLLVSYYTYKNREYSPNYQDLKINFNTPEVPFQFSVQRNSSD